MTDTVPEDVRKLAREAYDRPRTENDEPLLTSLVHKDAEENVLSAIHFAILADREARGDGWMDIQSAPRDGTRLLLMWEPFGGIAEHVELGKWSVRNGWVNTYGHAFNGAPSHYMLLPAPPAEGSK